MAKTDELIKRDVVEQLIGDSRVDASKISVEVNNGNVTLRGEVPTYFSRISAYEDAYGILGVTNVRNHLVVEHPPAFSLPTDDDIKINVSNRLAANPDIDLIDMEVDVTAGQVTLRGTVDAFWKKLHAEQLAANEPGVVSIENHLAVVPTEDIVDKAIAEDIIDSLERKALVDAEDITVRVRDGDVTLTGSVPSWAARRAAEDSALHAAGVKNVTNRLTVTGIL